MNEAIAGFADEVHELIEGVAETTQLKAVLSVRPEYADKIRTGEKTVEYRRTHLAQLPAAFVIYRTGGPAGRIIGEVGVTGLTMGTPDIVWDRTSQRGCISRDAYDSYFAGRRTAYAYELGAFRELDQELTLEQLGLSRPPQSFAYVRHTTNLYTGSEDWSRK